MLHDNILSDTHATPCSCPGTSASQHPSITPWRHWSTWWCHTSPRSTKTTWTLPGTPTTVWQFLSRSGVRVAMCFIVWMAAFTCFFVMCCLNWHYGLFLFFWSAVLTWWTEALSSSWSTTMLPLLCPEIQRYNNTNYAADSPFSRISCVMLSHCFVVVVVFFNADAVWVQVRVPPCCVQPRALRPTKPAHAIWKGEDTEISRWGHPLFTWSNF